jgi:hypothetical protein
MKDLNITLTRALTASDGSVTSSDFDLGATSDRNAAGSSVKDVELVVEVPALTSSELNTADTLILLVQTGDAVTPTTSAGLTKTITGTGSTIAAQEVKFRLPPTVGRYVNVKATTAGTSGDMSAKSLTISLRPKLY